MKNSEEYRDMLKKAREEGEIIGRIKAQKSSNKILLSNITHPSYIEVIEDIELIDDLDTLDDIFERALVHLKLMSDIERITEKIKKDRDEEKITKEELYQMIIRSNKELNEKIDNIEIS